jgi:hypothetical protein
MHNGQPDETDVAGNNPHTTEACAAARRRGGALCAIVNDFVQTGNDWRTQWQDMTICGVQKPTSGHLIIQTHQPETCTI